MSTVQFLLCNQYGELNFDFQKYRCSITFFVFNDKNIIFKELQPVSKCCIRQSTVIICINKNSVYSAVDFFEKCSAVKLLEKLRHIFEIHKKNTWLTLWLTLLVII